MAVFEESSYSNLTNVTQIFDVAGTFTEGAIGFGIWLLISVGVFFILSGYNSKDGLVAAGFVSLIASLFLAYIGLLAGVFVIISLIIFVIAIVLAISTKGGGGM